MPGGDGTGPLGAGPMTGRGAGFCAGFNIPGYANPAPGPGFWGRGRGFRRGGGGRGWRHCFWATGLPGWMRVGWGSMPYTAEPTPEAERRFLDGQAQALRSQLDAIEKRLEELKSDKVR